MSEESAEMRWWKRGCRCSVSCGHHVEARWSVGAIVPRSGPVAEAHHHTLVLVQDEKNLGFESSWHRVCVCVVEEGLFWAHVEQ